MYVDGFILAVPSRKLPAYRRLSLKAANCAVLTRATPRAPVRGPMS